MDAAEILEGLVGYEELFGKDGPCPILHEPGNPRIVMITGGNASGKSLFAKAYRAFVAQDDNSVERMHVDMKIRSEGGIRRAFMFGDEDWESTGQISVKAIIGGIATCRGREKDHILVLDEPCVGLANGTAMGVGELLAEFAADLPERTKALVIVTHSREIVSRLLPLQPTCIRVGDDLRPTATWIAEGDIPLTAEDVKNIQKKSVERFRAIGAVLDDRKTAKSPSPK
jgi:predicted ATPase